MYTIKWTYEKGSESLKIYRGERHRKAKVDMWEFQSPRASATMNHRLEKMLIKEYTAKEMKLLKANVRLRSMLSSEIKWLGADGEGCP